MIDEVRFLSYLKDDSITLYNSAMDAISKSKVGTEERLKILRALEAVLNEDAPDGYTFSVTEGNKAVRITGRPPRPKRKGL